MDNRHLRAIILKIQDRLSDDDRRRLHFFLGDDVPRRIRDDSSLSGTLSLMETLFDRDIINEQDFTFLINAFDEIQCTDAVKLLQEHKRRIQSNEIKDSTQSLSILMPRLLEQIIDEDDKISAVSHLLDDRYTKIPANRNTRVINSNTNDTVGFIVNNHTDSPLRLQQTQHRLRTLSSMKKYLILPVVLLVILMAFVIGASVSINRLKTKYDNVAGEQINNNAKLQYLKDIQTKANETIIRLNGTLSEKVREVHRLKTKLNSTVDEEEFTEGSTCTCDPWCRGRGYLYGVCGNGHTCICRDVPITNNMTGSMCTCNEWCQWHGHIKGGICGDGYTCICSK